MLNIKGFV